MGYTVSVVARILGVSARTVSDWSRRGILKPTRAASGWNYYSPEEVERVRRARAKTR